MNEPKTHKLSEAVEGTQPETPGHAGPPEPQGPGSTPQEVAEEARRQQETRSHGQPSRDEYLTSIGRGQQTHG